MKTTENVLRRIRKELNLTQEEMGRRFGITKSALSMIETGKQALSERNKNILIQDLNVNPDWLETGRGAMFNALPEVKPPARNVENAVPYQSIPLYNMDESVGLTALFANSDSFKPLDYIHIPNMPKCDGAIRVAGEVMEPLLKSGDIVLYKQLRDTADIFWGDMYLISVDLDGEEFITIRFIDKSEIKGNVRLVSRNSHFADKEVQMSKIRAIAFVKATIRMNSIR